MGRCRAMGECPAPVEDNRRDRHAPILSARAGGTRWSQTLGAGAPGPPGRGDGRGDRRACWTLPGEPYFVTLIMDRPPGVAGGPAGGTSGLCVVAAPSPGPVPAVARRLPGASDQVEEALDLGNGQRYQIGGCPKLPAGPRLAVFAWPVVSLPPGVGRRG